MSHDVSGDVEYLLYKDGEFSNASAFDLYYYVRDAVGNITDLFQIREQSGSSTTVVNRIAAHYEYDPYGNILSVDKYNNDPIGDINPIRYKDYYYDLQTGWYQLSSRFYDPEVGRFLNADDLSLLMETDSGVVDKNLYAYCDGNPVMRKDNEGDYWYIFAGAAIGAAFEAASQLSKDGEITSVSSILVSAGAGAICAAIPVGGSLVVGTATFIQEKYLAKEPSSTKQALKNAGISAGLSLICGGGISKNTKNVLNTMKSGKSSIKGLIKSIKKKSTSKTHRLLSAFHSSKLYYLYSSFSYHIKRNRK